MTSDKTATIAQIDKRYSGLAESTCCLSCGGAVDKAKPQEGEYCVDLGSGRGTDVIRMAEEVGREGFAWGIDTSEGMLAKAKKTATKLGVDNVRFMHGTFDDIPLKAETADLVISNCAINHAENKDLVWKEVYRILRGGGRFVVSDIYSTSEVPEKYKNDPEAVAECWGGAVTKDKYMASLERAGFSNITILEESDPYDKGEVRVASFTVTGWRPGGGCCCC